MINARASRIGLQIICGAAGVPPAIPVEHDNELARIGTAAHEFWTEGARGHFDVHDEEHVERTIDQLTVVHRIKDRTDLGFVCRGLWRSWEKVSSWFPGRVLTSGAPKPDAFPRFLRAGLALVEQPVEWHTGECEACQGRFFYGGSGPESDPDVPCEDCRGTGFAIHLPGHIDLLSLTEWQGSPEARICDAKTGHLDVDWWPQMLAYALMVLMAMPEVATVYCAILRPRDPENGYIAQRWTRAEVLAWWEKAAERIADQEHFVSGPHCGHCPRLGECPAAGQFLAKAASVLINQKSWNLENFTGNLAKIHDARKVLAGYIDRAAEWERAIVEGAGGRLPLGDGRALELVIQERKGIRWPESLGEATLHEALGDRFREAISVSLTKAVDLVKEASPHGKKGFAAKRLMEWLEREGLLTKTTFTKLVERMEDHDRNRITQAANGTAGESLGEGESAQCDGGTISD